MYGQISQFNKLQTCNSYGLLYSMGKNEYGKLVHLYIFTS